MSNKTLVYLGLAAGAYFFLKSRTPSFTTQANGTVTPTGILDQLTVALTGIQPPLSQVQAAQNSATDVAAIQAIPGIISSIGQAIH
jgi:hypothetical protein